MLSSGTIATLVLFGALGGLIGWRRSTKSIHRRSLRQPEVPPGITRREFDRQVRRRRKILRPIVTGLHILAGLALAAMFLAIVTR